ncbi:MAG: Histidinol-phosphate aminotransferase, partial [Desulfofundulus kuznetsovii]
EILPITERKHGGNVYQVARQYGLDLEEIVDFSASVSPLGVPEAVMQAVKTSLETIMRYPDPACQVFRQAAALELGVESENIIAGNGAAELIYLIVRMLLPRRALLPVPTFSEYEHAVGSAGGRLRYVQLQPENTHFVFPVDDFCKAIQGADLAFICNPNNPTGTLLDKTALQEILEAGKDNHCFIVVDEAYLDFVKDGSDYSLVKQVLEYDNLLIIKSLTKVYALPGLRIGYAIGNKALIRKMNNLRDPWSVNALAQAAGAAALQDGNYRTSLQEMVWEEREFLYEEIKKLPGLKPYLTTANFILVDTSATGFTVGYLQENLARAGLLIRDCTSIKGLGPYYFRIAIRTRAENARLIKALNELLKKWEP